VADRVVVLYEVNGTTKSDVIAGPWISSQMWSGSDGYVLVTVRRHEYGPVISAHHFRTAWRVDHYRDEVTP